MDQSNIGKKSSSPSMLLGSEAYLRDLLERALKEVKTLKARAESLEKENSALKKSIYELTYKYTAFVQHTTSHTVLFEKSTSTSNTGNSGSVKKWFPLNLDSLDSDPVKENVQTLLGSSPSGALAKTAEKRYPSPNNRATENSPSNAYHVRHNNSKNFIQKGEFKGHLGAVYAVNFSPCGRMLASSSFDQSAKVWDVGTQKEILSLRKHKLNVSDISWSNDSLDLLSSSYDMHCRTWDISTGKLTGEYSTLGFSLCSSFIPKDKNLFAYGTSKNVIGLVDRRNSSLKSDPISIMNDSMVNCIYAYHDGSYILTGDSNGYLKTWDLRTGKAVYVTLNDQTRQPITCVTTCKRSAGQEDEPRLLAVNSYDNIIRIYDRGFIPPKTRRSLLHILKGHRNKNWPIKSSFYHGKSFKMETNSRKDDPEYRKDLESFHGYSNALESTVLLATGSSDHFAYIFDVGGNEGSGELIQRLEGHSDKVYSVSFHPWEPILATASADFTIKLWST